MTEPARTAPSRADAVDPLIGAPLGRAIREARSARQLSMRALAREADMSQSFLSQIEAGQTMPSLLTLYRIAQVLGVPPASLLPADPAPDLIHVARRASGELLPIAERPDAATGRILASGSTRGAHVIEYRVEDGQYIGDWYESRVDLTVYVVAGTVHVEIEGHGTWTLEEGDAITHPGSLRNRWSVDAAATILLIHTPEKSDAVP